MQARHFDPVIGRFLSTDPIGYQDQFNLYAYVHNDPVNNWDPNGEFAIALANPVVRGPLGGAVGGAIGTAFNAGAQALKNNGQVNWNDAFAAGAAASAVSTAVAVNPTLATNPGALAKIGGAAGVAGSVGGDLLNGEPINVPDAAVSGISGTLAAPGAAQLGNAVENAFGAAASSFLGEVGGAVAGEALAGAVNAAAPQLSNGLQQAGSAFVDGIEAVNNAAYNAADQISNMNENYNPCSTEGDC